MGMQEGFYEFCVGVAGNWGEEYRLELSVQIRYDPDKKQPWEFHFENDELNNKTKGSVQNFLFFVKAKIS